MLKKSTVIKASEKGTGPVKRFGLRSFHLDDVMAEAVQQVEASRAEAEAAVREAKGQADAIRREARESGYQEGFDQGQTEGREAGRAEAFELASKEFSEQQKNLIETCQQIIAAIETDRSAWYTAARQDLIDLVMAIARRIVRHVGEKHREVVLANLEEAVRIVGARTDVTIAVHPDDAEAARAFAKSLIDLQEQWEHVRVTPEPNVSRGGCRMYWDTGAIDATLETQLDRISAELKGDCSAAGKSTETVEDK